MIFNFFKKNKKISDEEIRKDTHNQLIEKWGPYLEVNDPALYESMTGKKLKNLSLNFLNQRRKLKR